MLRAWLRQPQLHGSICLKLVNPAAAELNASEHVHGSQGVGCLKLNEKKVLDRTAPVRHAGMTRAAECIHWCSPALVVGLPPRSAALSCAHGFDAAQRRTGTKGTRKGASQPALDCETCGALTPAARFRYFSDRLICEACDHKTRKAGCVLSRANCWHRARSDLTSFPAMATPCKRCTWTAAPCSARV
jgi:hypothetical protein